MKYLNLTEYKVNSKDILVTTVGLSPVALRMIFAKLTFHYVTKLFGLKIVPTKDR